MEMLKQLGLAGNGLRLIDSLEMVKRYNNCLDSFGLEKTKLKSFRIDGSGWSPEIADEQGNMYYLSHGEANPLWIILFPEQRHCPIYNPIHSFDWELLKQWMDTHRPQIATVTRYEGICLDIDQEVDLYKDPEDLLLIDMVIVRAWTPSRLMEKAHEQKALVRRFLREDDAHLDAELIEGILSSALNIGDLRQKQLFIPNMEFSDVACFYTGAFGGTFVLRGPASDEAILISKADTRKAIGVTAASDKKVLKQLDSLGLISYDVERWLKELHRLRIIRDSFLMDVLDKKKPDLDYVALSSVKKKGLLNQKGIKKVLPEEYMLLDRLIGSLKRGRIPKRISPKIRPYLAHPVENLEKSTKEVVWYVLAMVCDGRNVVRLYRYDKDAFFETYEKIWKTPWKSFAIDCVKKYYQYRMMKQE